MILTLNLTLGLEVVVMLGRAVVMDLRPAGDGGIGENAGAGVEREGRRVGEGAKGALAEIVAAVSWVGTDPKVARLSVGAVNYYVVALA